MPEELEERARYLSRDYLSKLRWTKVAVQTTLGAYVKREEREKKISDADVRLRVAEEALVDFIHAIRNDETVSSRRALRIFVEELENQPGLPYRLHSLIGSCRKELLKPRI